MNENIDLTKILEGWINIYTSEVDYYPGNCIYSTKEEAVEVGKQSEDYITTIKIEWEE